MKEIAQYRFCSETGFKEASQPEMIIIALDQTQSLAHRKILVDRAGNPINRFDCPLDFLCRCRLELFKNE